MNFSYKFPAVRGTQANREYYVSMVPLKFLSKIFVSDTDVVDPEFRAQRHLNESRIPAIKKYIIDNRQNYVFSALSASIDGNFNFTPFHEQQDIGILEIDMNTTFLINDGQHRKAAIEEALKDDVTLGDETISVVFFEDKGLSRSQQMFTDLNKHAVRTSNSLSTLYDSRDPLSVVTKDVIRAVPFFNQYTDKEKDNLGANSSKLFTLNNMYKANSYILKHNQVTDESKKYLILFWNNIVNNIEEWQELSKRELSKKDLRQNYILCLNVTILAFGHLGAYFYANPDADMISTLKKLKTIDWSRSNLELWQDRAIRRDGKVNTGETAVILINNKIKQLLGITLSTNELNKEQII